MDYPTARASVIECLKISCGELELIEANDMEITLWALDVLTILANLQSLIAGNDRDALTALAKILENMNPKISPE